MASLGGDSDVITKTWAAREARGGAAPRRIERRTGLPIGLERPWHGLGLTPPSRGRRKAPEPFDSHTEPDVAFDDGASLPVERTHAVSIDVTKPPPSTMDALVRPPVEALLASRGRSIRFRGGPGSPATSTGRRGTAPSTFYNWSASINISFRRRRRRGLPRLQTNAKGNSRTRPTESEIDMGGNRLK